MFYWFQREEGRERNTDVREKYLLDAFRRHSTKDQTRNPGMCPDWGLNLQPFGVQDDAPTNWATQPGL